MSNIVLVGYMGCGKTTIGKNLARNLNWKFVDTDEQIEAIQQRTITNIFAEDGEAAFRGMETAYLHQLLENQVDGIVLSTGGGMPLSQENRALLRKIGKVIYLKAEPETVYNRIKGDTKRPLLQCENPLAKIQQMTIQRAPFYEEAANQVIHVDDMKQSEIADYIQKTLE